MAVSTLVHLSMVISSLVVMLTILLNIMRGADFLINPMLQGSGSNIKIAQAISAELPILSSRFGMRGFDVIENEDYLLIERDDLKASLLQAIKNKVQAKEAAIKLRQKSLSSIDGIEICKAKLVPLLNGSIPNVQETIKN